MPRILHIVAISIQMPTVTMLRHRHRVVFAANIFIFWRPSGNWHLNEHAICHGNAGTDNKYKARHTKYTWSQWGQRSPCSNWSTLTVPGLPGPVKLSNRRRRRLSTKECAGTVWKEAWTPIARADPLQRAWNRSVCQWSRIYLKYSITPTFFNHNNCDNSQAAQLLTKTDVWTRARQDNMDKDRPTLTTLPQLHVILATDRQKVKDQSRQNNTKQHKRQTQKHTSDRCSGLLSTSWTLPCKGFGVALKTEPELSTPRSKKVCALQAFHTGLGWLSATHLERSGYGCGLWIWQPGMTFHDIYWHFFLQVLTCWDVTRITPVACRMVTSPQPTPMWRHKRTSSTPARRSRRLVSSDPAKPSEWSPSMNPSVHQSIKNNQTCQGSGLGFCWFLCFFWYLLFVFQRLFLLLCQTCEAACGFQCSRHMPRSKQEDDCWVLVCKMSSIRFVRFLYNINLSFTFFCQNIKNFFKNISRNLNKMCIFNKNGEKKTHIIFCQTSLFLKKTPCLFGIYKLSRLSGPGSKHRRVLRPQIGQTSEFEGICEGNCLFVRKKTTNKGNKKLWKAQICLHVKVYKVVKHRFLCKTICKQILQIVPRFL